MNNILFCGSDPGGAKNLELAAKVMNQRKQAICQFLDISLEHGSNQQLVQLGQFNSIVLGTSHLMEPEMLAVELLQRNYDDMKIFIFVDEIYNVRNRLSPMIDSKHWRNVNAIFYQKDTPKTEIIDDVVGFFVGSPLLDSDAPQVENLTLFPYKFDKESTWVVVDEFKEQFLFDDDVVFEMCTLSDILADEITSSKWKVRRHPKFTSGKTNYSFGNAKGFIGYSSFFLAQACMNGFPTITLASPQVMSLALTQFKLMYGTISNLNILTAQNFTFEPQKSKRNVGAINAIADVLTQ